MKILPANQLARKFEVGTTEKDYFKYIIKSGENGQYRQVYDLFDRMELHNKETFIHYLQQKNEIEILRQIAIHLL